MEQLRLEEIIPFITLPDFRQKVDFSLECFSTSHILIMNSVILRLFFYILAIKIFNNNYYNSCLLDEITLCIFWGVPHFMVLRDYFWLLSEITLGRYGGHMKCQGSNPHGLYAKKMLCPVCYHSRSQNFIYSEQPNKAWI